MSLVTLELGLFYEGRWVHSYVQSLWPPALCYTVSYFIRGQWSSSLFVCLSVFDFSPRQTIFLGTNSHFTVRDECNYLFKWCLRLTFLSHCLIKKLHLSRGLRVLRAPFVTQALFIYLFIFRLCFSAGTVRTSHHPRLVSSAGTQLWSLSTRLLTLSSSNSTPTSLELASLS